MGVFPTKNVCCCRTVSLGIGQPGEGWKLWKAIFFLLPAGGTIIEFDSQDRPAV
jgi:hypothetical protein